MTEIPEGDPDASHWATRFAAHVRLHPGAVDEPTLGDWFRAAIATGRELAWDDILSDAGRARRVAESAEQRARAARLAARYGMPEHVCANYGRELAAAAQVPVDPTAAPDDIYASIYRDGAAADAYAESNLAHHGHPTLARVPLKDGRVLGILDLRPSLERARREARELDWRYGPTETDPDPAKMWCDDCGGEVTVHDGAYVCGCGRQSKEDG